ncbi:MAG: NADH-quinone oxidoreductase subunit J [Actinomycetes bacterium]
MAETVGFWLLAIISVVTALMVVLNRNPVRCALYLIINFICLALFYLMLQAEVLAVLQVVVYAGAIMVLFLFVLMLLGVESQESVRETIRGQRPAAVLLTLGLLVAIVAALLAGVFDTAPASLAAANQGGNVQAVGRLLFTHYTFAFETAGVLLMVAAVGALVLGKRQP